MALYLAHDFDPDTPQEETLQAFGELVRAGKIGAVGASNFTGEQLAEALELASSRRCRATNGCRTASPCSSRATARSVFPVCHEHGLGYTPFSPLAGGWLTGKYRRGETPPPGSRMTLRPEPYAGYSSDRVFDALEALAAEAAARDVSMAGLALAWLLALDEVTAIVVGPGRSEHLAPAVEALSILSRPPTATH